MYIADDPTLALIARFLGDPLPQDRSEFDFLHQQMAAIEQHVAGYPPADRETQALAWIEANARRYRQQWQKHKAVDLLANARCTDCPLVDCGEGGPCTIHSRWLDLLQRYAADEISSRDYVEQSLALLRLHKDRLRVHADRDVFPAAASARRVVGVVVGCAVGSE